MHIDERSDEPIYQQIYRQIHDGVETGAYPPGSRLPSIRGLADDVGCSRNTVEAAYRMLVAEGYVASRPGSGYVACDLALVSPSAPERPVMLGEPAPCARYDFTYGDLEPGTFPAAAWRALTDDVLLSVEGVGCDAYNDPAGEPELRAEVAWRLTTQRGIDCTPDQVIIQGGTCSGVRNLLALFDPRDVVAMEDPGYGGVRAAVERARFAVAPCRVGDDYAHFLDDLDASGARLAYVTPSSQFPTCQVMPAALRARLLEWARDRDAFILEDDYCRDFRYRERSLPPLASMDRRGRVIYMGTFSKSLSPALRINYLVLPEPLRDRWREAFASSYSPVPWLNQQVLARFMTDGSWDRHLRRVQAKNRRKYETLTRVLRATMGNDVEMLENGTGLHLLVRVRDGRPQDELVRQAAEADVAVYPTKKYWTDPARHVSSTVLVGFSSIAEDDIEPGIRALAAAWFG